MQTSEQETVEQVETEEVSPSVEIEAGVSVEASGLQDTLAEIADTFDVTGFKCVKCGLAHQHDTTKHQLSKTFDVSDSEAASMEYNSTCHCGAHEAGRGSGPDIDTSKAADIASGAPIPPEASREMNEQFGSL